MAQEHEPDLIVIDTAMAATSVPDVNDNSAVVALFKELRTIAEQSDTAILMLHHERKPQAGQSGDTGQAMMGARQWAGQPDAHLTLRLVEREVTPGQVEAERHRTVATLQVPKLRDGVPPPPETVAITSEKRERGRLAWARVESEGRVEKKRSKTQQLADRMASALRERGEMGSGALAEQVISKVKHGVYGPGEGML